MAIIRLEALLCTAVAGVIPPYSGGTCERKLTLWKSLEVAAATTIHKGCCVYSLYSNGDI